MDASSSSNNNHDNHDNYDNHANYDNNEQVKEDVKDTKPDATNTEHINIKVVSADNSEVMFKIKRSTKLAKLMQAYCTRAGKTFDTVRFLVDGERINGDSTPDSLGLEDGDAIDAMTEQIGGSWC